ncbi:MAG: thiol reductase thioredoxin, partial [Myxococcota bacterium]
MRATVFTDAALVNHAGRFVWLSIDLTNPVNSSFLEQFPLDGLPMLVVIDPNTGQGVLKWMGTLDVHQLVGLLDDGERAMPHPDEPGGPDATVEADRLAGAGRYLPAARAYRRVLRALPSDAPERGRVAVAYVGAYQAAEAYRPCARAAVEV